MNIKTLELEARRKGLRALIQRLEEFDRSPLLAPPAIRENYKLLALCKAHDEYLTAEIDLANFKERAATPRHYMNEWEESESIRILKELEASYTEKVERLRKEEPEHQKALIATVEQIRALESATSAAGAASVSVPAREVWTGALWEFVERIIAENKHGRTGTGWERQAVINAAKGFDVMDKKTGLSKPLSGKNAWQAWRNKMDDETPHK